MKVVIIPSENRVSIDGESRIVDLSGLAADIHIVRFDTDAKIGEIEHIPQKTGGKANEVIDDVSPFQAVIDAWAGAPPVVDTPPVDVLETKRVIALREFEEEQLESRANDPDAPQSVKDYITEKRRPPPRPSGPPGPRGR